MVIHSGILANSLRARFPRPRLFHNFFVSAKSYLTSTTQPKPPYVDEDYSDFLPWLERRAGATISSALSIGKSPRGGRGLFASEHIKKGDRILKIPFSVQLAHDNLPPEISSLLGKNLDPVTKVALVILHEKKLGQDSEWAPYISCLPLPHEMHSSVFWSDEELEMIRPSCLYEETLGHKKLIEGDFLAVKSVFDRFPSHLRDTTLEDFTHAYQLVKSRAWNNRRRGVTLVPFVDFINHDNTSEAKFVNDEKQQHSKIIADRDFAAGEEVTIRYGEYANSTLLSSFGFTIPGNTYDLDMVRLSSMAQGSQVCNYSSDLLPFWNGVQLNEVRSMDDIPSPLRAFARTLVCGSKQVGWYPLEDKEREIAAHQFLHDELSKLMDNRDEHIKLVVAIDVCEKSVVRRQLALDVLEGEQRVLKSACAYLKYYCISLRSLGG